MSSSSLWDLGDLEYLDSCALCGCTHFQPFLHRWDGLKLVECSGCGLVFVNPQPSWQQILHRYDEAYFTGQRDFYKHKRYIDVTRWMVEARAGPGVDHFRRHVNPRGQRLLEVGCGYGAFLVIAREMGAIVRGVELSSHAAAVARQEFGLEDTITGRLEDAGFADALFDIVTFFDLLEHVPEPTAFMTEVRRVLRPGGMLFFLVPNLARYDLEGLHWPGIRYHPEHLYYYRLNTLQPWLERLGFHVQQHWTEGVSHAPPGNPTIVRSVRTHPLRRGLKRVPGLAPMLRLGRKLWNGDLLEAWRAHRGYGHNLIVLASRIESPSV